MSVDHKVMFFIWKSIFFHLNLANGDPDVVYACNLQSGGPYWDVPAGRFDGRVSNATDASILPSPSFKVTQLTDNFASKGFNQTEMVTLSGGRQFN